MTPNATTSFTSQAAREEALVSQEGFITHGVPIGFRQVVAGC